MSTTSQLRSRWVKKLSELFQPDQANLDEADIYTEAELMLRMWDTEGV